MMGSACSSHSENNNQDYRSKLLRGRAAVSRIYRQQYCDQQYELDSFLVLRKLRTDSDDEETMQCHSSKRHAVVHEVM